MLVLPERPDKSSYLVIISYQFEPGRMIKIERPSAARRSADTDGCNDLPVVARLGVGEDR